MTTIILGTQMSEPLETFGGSVVSGFT